jgi:hemolysin III
VTTLLLPDLFAPCDREHSRAEVMADGAIHILGLSLAPLGAALLFQKASNQTWMMPVVVYIICLFAMLSLSAAYNMRRRCRYRPLLRRLDQAGIFAMIAGSYTPFTLLGLTGFWSWGLTITVWSLALLGMTAKLCNWSWPERVWVPLYMAIGWLVVVAIQPLSEALPLGTVHLLIAGGVIYTVGVIFHLWERLRFQTAVWHGFVLAGAGVHFYAVLTLA